MSDRWQQADVARGDDYDARWDELAAEGRNLHGEADLVSCLLAGTPDPAVLDAGCGTGRVAIELARRGMRVTGVDADPAMLSTARRKSPQLRWEQADLAALPRCIGPPERDTANPAAPREGFDLALLAGNVMIFLEPGTEQQVLCNLAALLVPGGMLVAGFSLRPDEMTVQRYDELAAAAHLEAVQRWATWDRQPFTGGDYAVSVHRRVRG